MIVTNVRVQCYGPAYSREVQTKSWDLACEKSNVQIGRVEMTLGTLGTLLVLGHRDGEAGIKVWRDLRGQGRDLHFLGSDFEVQIRHLDAETFGAILFGQTTQGPLHALVRSSNPRVGHTPEVRRLFERETPSEERRRRPLADILDMAREADPTLDLSRTDVSLRESNYGRTQILTAKIWPVIVHP